MTPLITTTAGNGVTLSGGKTGLFRLAIPEKSDNGATYSNRSNCVAGARVVVGPGKKPDADFQVAMKPDGRYVWWVAKGEKAAAEPDLTLPPALDRRTQAVQKPEAARAANDQDRSASGTTAVVIPEAERNNEEPDVRNKTSKAASANARKPVKTNSVQTVADMMARKGGASMDELCKVIGIEPHPMRTKIYFARHRLGYDVRYDTEKARYFATPGGSGRKGAR
jgi:hypothetical protein